MSHLSDGVLGVEVVPPPVLPRALPTSIPGN